MVAGLTTRSWLPGALLCLSGCAGVISWLPIYTSHSPDRKWDVRVEVRKCLADCAVRVVLNDRWLFATQLGSGEDCNVAFAHVIWVGSKVGVYVDGAICPPIKAAYDVNAKRKVPFAELEDDMRRSIIADYGVTQEEIEENGGDVFKWASFRSEGDARRSLLMFREKQRSNR